ncbi:MAG: alpha/beta-hydrolase N-terminal domain-containing protein, partial [Nitriliruptoraceae bacterium]
MQTALRTEATEQDRATAAEVFTRPVSRAGLLGAALFFSLSLLPSLLPRTAVAQGVVSGITVALGYGLGVFVRWVAAFLEIPPLRGRARAALLGAWSAVLALALTLAVWRHIGWQNEVRSLFDVDPVGPTAWLVIIPVTLVVAAILLILVRSVRKLFRSVKRGLERGLPRRVAILLGAVASVVVLSLLWNGLLVDGFFALANRSFAPIDAATDEGVVQTTSVLRSGGPGSLVAWDTLGRKGRTFVATGPTIEELEDFHQREVLEPIRVYAG